MTLSRRLQRAVNQVADRNSERLDEIPAARIVKATVTTVTPGGASDGNALVKVTWRGEELDVNDYPDTYTPAVNDRVRCVLDPDGELGILHHCIGAP